MSGLPSGWCEASISDLVDLNPKQAFEDDVLAGFVPMAHAPTNFRDKLEFDERPWSEIKKAYTNFQNGDVIFAKVTPCFENGKAALVEGLPNGIGAGSSEFFVLRPACKDVSAKYLLAIVKSHGFMTEGAQNMTGAVGLRRVPRQFVECYRVPVPPAAEQTRIASKLDELLAQVDTLKARIDGIPALLKRFRQSVLAAAVSGRLTEDWRRNNYDKTTKSLLENHTPLPRPARWKSRSDAFMAGNYAIAVGKPASSDVEGWSWVSLVDVAKMESGHTPSRSKAEYWGGDICWIGIRDANQNHSRTIWETEQKTNGLGLANSASRLLPAGTVCISRTASVGYVVQMGKEMATSQDFVNWVPTDVVYSEWLKWLFVAERESLYKFGKGSTHTTVYFPEWLSMHVLLPHVDEQKEIVRRVEQFFAFADQLEARIKAAQARIDRLTQSILAKAFRGELVPQDPNDEPASVLLGRIKAQRAAAPKAKRGR